LSNIEWVASDGSNHSEHLWGDGGFIPWDKIGQEALVWGVQYAREKVVGADCLVAYMDTHDCYGSIVELTLAATFGKSCLLVVLMPPMILNDDEDSSKRFDAVAENMADAYWFVSCLPGVRAVTVESEAEATDVIRGFLLQMQPSIPKTRGGGL
jgi:hypothetical protein